MAICDSPLTKDLGRYLGVLVLHSKINRAMLLKLGWRLKQDDENLSAKVIKGKYGLLDKGRNFMDVF